MTISLSLSLSLSLDHAVTLATAAEKHGVRCAESYQHAAAAEYYEAASAIWAQFPGPMGASKAADLTERAARQRFIDQKVNGSALNAKAEG